MVPPVEIFKNFCSNLKTCPKLTELTVSIYDKAITALSPYMWDGGLTHISLPIELLTEPDPEWGARNVIKFLSIPSI